ncbi:alpha/beta fold hydrolase [Actinoplanes sp. NPDC051861]|uniref:alpha/beta hydrolase n=1 Tax=Actinoplanes sp. NPDC051861 TaxID=3155170 RepID=UPI00343C5349
MVLVRGALILLVVLVLVVAVAWAAQRRLIYFPERAAPAGVAGVEEVELRTADGLRLGAWLVRPAEGVPDRRLSVLVTPGNAGSRAGRLPLAGALAGRGMTVLLVDYRGYGGNPGSPSEDGLARDADAARDYLVREVGLPIIYFGESLGAAVATALAVRHPPVGLVLRSPFEDLAAAGREHYPVLPVGWLLRDRFPVRGLISRVEAPVVVVHGTADEVVPAGQSAAVASAAGNLLGTVVVEGAGHNDRVLLDGPQLIDAVTALADHIRAGER